MPDKTTELTDGIQRIAEQTGKDVRLHIDSVLVELQDLCEDRVHAFMDYRDWFRWPSLKDMVHITWHRRFEQALKLIYEPKSQTHALCISGSVSDLVYTLDQAALNRLEDWCLNHPLNATPSSQDVRNAVNNPKDILAALEKAFQSKGLKPVVETYALREEIRSSFPLSSQKTGLGGAASIIAEALNQLGVTARVHSLYHSAEQADCFDPGLETEWVDLSSGKPQYRRARVNGQADQPTRNTIVLAYSKGLHLRSANVSAGNTDRSLLIMRPYYGTQACPNYVVSGKPVNLLPGTPAGAFEWPMAPGLIRWSIAGGQLNMDPVSDQAVRRLAQDHHYVILNGPGLGQLQQPGNTLVNALLRQIGILSRMGASLHLEISGGADSNKHRIAPFAQALKGLIRSMGINDEELMQIATLPDYSSGITPAANPAAPDVYRRYVHALRLAETLGLERLYVHGNDVDIILRRGASEGMLQQEIHADLFTKGAVIVSILLRNGHSPQTYPLPRALYAEGFKALIEFAWQFSQVRHPGNPEQRKRLFKQITEDGYYLAAGRNEYSVSIAPVMWPEAVRLDPSINTTGAGDTCSGISLLYSGWR